MSKSSQQSPYNPADHSTPADHPTRAVIISGGELGPWVLEHIQAHDLIIAADYGAWFAVQNGIRPHMSLGDFDSIQEEQLALVKAHSEAVQTCDPVWKDLTDTEMAWEYALSQGVQEIVLLGATGTRLDHTLTNIHLLSKAESRGIRAVLIDANNEIRLVSQVSKQLRVERKDYKYVSLIPLTDRVTGVTLEGFRYPLQDAELTFGESLGISNELIEHWGSIELKSGKLLVIQSKD